MKCHASKRPADETARFQKRRASGRSRARGARLRIAASDGANKRIVIEISSTLFKDPDAVFQHQRPIGKFDSFAQTMRDVDDARALHGKSPDGALENVDLFAVQCRRRLVEHQHMISVTPSCESANDRDDRTLRGGQRGYW